MSDRINLSVPIVEIPRPDMPVTLLEAAARAYRMNGCTIIVSHDGGVCWHISISRTDRDPTWAEIVTARYRLLPEVPNMAMHLPALWTGEYVNLNKHCFHLYEEKPR